MHGLTRREYQNNYLTLRLHYLDFAFHLLNVDIGVRFLLTHNHRKQKQLDYVVAISHCLQLE